VRHLVPLLVVLALVGCGGHSSRTVPPGAIATVGNHAIPRAALDAELARAERAYRARGQAFPARATQAYRQLEDAAVQVLVDRVRLEVEAERAGIAVPEAHVDERLSRLKQTAFGGDQKRYRAQLRSTGMTEAEVREAIRTQLLADALKDRRAKPPRVAYAPEFEPSDRP
jgi:SurA-like N-terminal domain